MVFIWGSGFGPRRRRRGYGPPPGWGGGGYGPGYGPGYGYRRGGGGGSCLRDLLLLDAGCCLAEMIGCGNNMFLVAPSTLRHVHAAGTASHGRLVDRMIAAIRVYQREISPKRPPVCKFEPSCSAYAVEALERHGAGRGAWLTVRRLFRCRPGAVGGADPVPTAA
jgi:putative membrane protein insertion efficiency factor